MIDWIKIHTQYILPKHLISRLLGFIAEKELGILTQSLIKLFIKAFNINMQEAEFESPTEYKTFNEFFTRPLKTGLRTIVAGENTLCHPVDGAVSQFGDIKGDRIFQAKGHEYSLTALLGGKPEIAKAFKNGKFATIYLAPRDYHRIHMPISGQLTDTLHVPGELFSVNPLTAQNVPGLFARNERVVALFDTPAGKVAMVLVGATVVASIETVWQGTVSPPAGKYVQHWQHEVDNILLNKGDEMGRFKLGSTVILCFEENKINFTDVSAGMTTRLGQQLALLQETKSEKAE
ncbi:archaetidylserine decarboxylase [Agaribacter flavus]|uniref:Phosphatidylserine decarboxylase proenzyme n=1 Tax=Agaribacter flavus TaxID=1902781 RepID=A0ABV7FUK3_9ALTE